MYIIFLWYGPNISVVSRLSISYFVLYISTYSSNCCLPSPFFLKALVVMYADQIILTIFRNEIRLLVKLQHEDVAFVEDKKTKERSELEENKGNVWEDYLRSYSRSIPTECCKHCFGSSISYITELKRKFIKKHIQTFKDKTSNLDYPQQSRSHWWCTLSHSSFRFLLSEQCFIIIQGLKMKRKLIIKCVC